MIRWGIIGLGNIANKFAESIKEVNNSKLIAIGSSTQKKLLKFGNKYNIQNIYRFDSYEKLLECKEIDAVYISTINTSHAKLIIKSIKAGKNILCEKPTTINFKEAKKVFNLLEKNKVFFAEAIPYRFHPQTKIITNTIMKGEIGKVQSVEIKFGFAVSKLLQFLSPNNRLFNTLGGGAILDTGCYCTSFALLMAKLINKNSDLSKFKLTNVSGTINRKAVEDLACAKIIFKNGLEAKVETSFRKKMENNVIINGTSGKMIIPNPWFPEKTTYIEVHSKFKNYKKKIKSKYSSRANMINVASDLIKKKLREGNYPLMSWKDSINNMKIINKWRDILRKA